MQHFVKNYIFCLGKIHNFFKIVSKLHTFLVIMAYISVINVVEQNQ